MPQHSVDVDSYFYNVLTSGDLYIIERFPKRPGRALMFSSDWYPMYDPAPTDEFRVGPVTKDRVTLCLPHSYRSDIIRCSSSTLSYHHRRRRHHRHSFSRLRHHLRLLLLCRRRHRRRRRLLLLCRRRNFTNVLEVELLVRSNFNATGTRLK